MPGLLFSPQRHMLRVLIRNARSSYFSTKTCYGYSLEVPGLHISSQKDMLRVLIRSVRPYFSTKHMLWILIRNARPSYFSTKNICYGYSLEVPGHLISSQKHMLRVLISARSSYFFTKTYMLWVLVRSARPSYFSTITYVVGTH